MNKNKGGYVYIMTNKHRNALYVGITSDISGRVYDHKNHVYKNSFTDRYNIEHLVYYEILDSIVLAIDREKEIKKWNRKKKDELIMGFNAEWRDLYEDVMMW